MKSKIVSIGIASPSYKAEQAGILEFMKKAYKNDDLASRKLNALFRFSGINYRYSVIPDFTNSQEPVFFVNENPQPDVQDRNRLFQEHAVSLSLKAINNALGETGIAPREITHLITVTCTGLAAPGLNAALMENLSLNQDTYNTSVNFMGCGAAFHGLKMADFILRSEEKAKVLVVCTEICTLHFQPKSNDDNLLSNTIFGDGAAAVLMLSGNSDEKGLLAEGFYSYLLPAGKDLMGWNINPVSFEMVLNGGVPDFISNEIEMVVSNASKYYHLDPDEINYWAVHPGGKKILDKINLDLGFQNGELRNSYDVLSSYGNLSSATILFVLKRILDNNIVNGSKIFAIGFGPGISIETCLFSYD